MDSRSVKSPSLLDIYAGRWLRQLRTEARMSRDDLAGHSDLTPQQIQKYESGLNRMSAGRLAEFAVILQRPVADFFRGAGILQEVFASDEPGSRRNTEAERAACDILIAYLAAGSDVDRQKIVDLVKPGNSKQLKDRDGVIFVTRGDLDSLVH